jgi:hypothetical protein
VVSFTLSHFTPGENRPVPSEQGVVSGAGMGAVEKGNVRAHAGNVTLFSVYIIP